MSWNEFRNDVLERVRIKLWAQWSALGVGSTAEYRSVTVDLEALLVGTWSFGRTDPRLFDEALSWCCRQFGDLVNAKRLKKLLQELDAPSTNRVAGAWVETIEAHGGADWGLGLETNSSDGSDSLFFDDDLEPQSSAANPNEIFKRWGLTRGPFNFRTHANPPDFSDPQLSQLAARKLMGTGCRSEVFALLLHEVDATTNELADMAVYSRRAIQQVLGDMSDAGMLNWNPFRGRSTRPALWPAVRDGFRAAQTRRMPPRDSEWSVELYDWPGFYLGLHALWRAMRRITRSGLDGFKAQSILRDALDEAREYHQRTNLRVHDPRLSADTLEEQVRQAQHYIDSLFGYGSDVGMEGAKERQIGR